MDKSGMSQILEEFNASLKTVEDARSLQDLKVQYLGKKGKVTGLMKEMKNLSKEERPEYGQKVNELRESIDSAINEKNEALEAAALEERLANETLDVTLPGRKFNIGSQHPISRIIEDIEDFFLGLGYEIQEGYEVETDYYNFEALNLPKSHPARDMQDSFYISEEILLRTHTSRCRHVCSKSVRGKKRSKSSVRARSTDVTVMMQRTVTSSHRLKDWSSIRIFI